MASRTGGVLFYILNVHVNVIFFIFGFNKIEFFSSGQPECCTWQLDRKMAL